jgi:uncharacterized membrane protein HdeD (DUF308 family)
MPTLLRKWWVLLIQGILLIILSIYVFNNPMLALLSLSFWISLLILFAGLAGIIGWFAAEKENRGTSGILWSIASIVLGILLIAKIGFAMNLLTNLFGIWMIITGFWLTEEGWNHRSNGSMGWVTLISGILSIVLGFFVIFNIGVGAVAISTLMGIQFLLAGIGLIILSLLKRKVHAKIKDVSQNIAEKWKQ